MHKNPGNVEFPGFSSLSCSRSALAELSFTRSFGQGKSDSCIIGANEFFQLCLIEPLYYSKAGEAPAINITSV